MELAILAEVMQRVSRLAEYHPAIREMEINPFLAASRGAKSLGLDARVVLGGEDARGRGGPEVPDPGRVVRHRGSR